MDYAQNRQVQVRSSLPVEPQPPTLMMQLQDMRDAISSLSSRLDVLETHVNHMMEIFQNVVGIPAV
jgi:hypothetical protein